MHENDVSAQIIGAAIEVHKHLGPGLLESVYQKCLAHEFGLRGIAYKSEYPITADYKGLELDSAYRIDLLVFNKVVVELKVVENLLPIHEAQLLSYMRLSKKRLGLIVNFNVPVLKRGIRRVVNEL